MSNSMRDLISGEAELDDEEDDESFDEETGETRERSRNRNQELDDSSEEDEDDDDEEEARKVREGFIVDEDEDEDEDLLEDEDERRKRRKRKRRQEREEEAQLDEEDLDLIGENIPEWERKQPSQGKFKRLKRGHRDDDPRGNERRGLDDMFSDEDDELADEQPYSRPSHRAAAGEFDDFIEEDFPEDEDERMRQMEDMEVARPRDKGIAGRIVDRAGLDKDALEDMEAIFGNGEDYQWALDEEEEEEERQREEQTLELKDVFEPSQLAEKLLTDEDNAIRFTDEPERFQLDRKPFKHLNIQGEQFKDEIQWIADLMWPKKQLSGDLHGPFQKAVGKVLEYFVLEDLEVPYVFQHRKDYLIHARKTRNPDHRDDPEAPEYIVNAEKLLTQDDLWRILELDIKYRSLFEKRGVLEKTWDNLREAMQVNDDMIPEMLSQAVTMEELQDLQDYINFQYASQLKDIAAMNGVVKGTKRPGAKSSVFERVRKSNAYKFVKAYGISPDRLAQNALREGKKMIADDEQTLPIDLADRLTDSDFPTGDQVLYQARHMYAEELFMSPRMRKYFRQNFYMTGEISCFRTEKGLRRIDESHPYYEIKYLINQTISDLARRPELFLKMMKAEEEGLIEVRLRLQNEKDFRRQLQAEFVSDNYSELADAWNEERKKVLDIAFAKLERVITKGVKDSLRTACQEELLKLCREEYSKRLDQAPYKPKGMVLGTTPRVLTLSNGMGDPARDPIFWVWVEEDGRVIEHGKFGNLARDESQREAFVELIERRKPDVIGVSGFCTDTHRLVRDLESLVNEKNLTGPEFPDPDTDDYRSELLEVVVVNDEVARLYKDSPRAQADHPTLTSNTRYCVALARYLQNPMKEYAALGKDITSLLFNPCQHLLPQEKLLKHLETSMVDMVNLCGVDINEAVSDAYTANLLPYVAGLGPRKATSVIKAINTNGGVVNSRDELVGDPDNNKLPVVGPRVWNNCASFLYIEYDPTNPSSEPLDNTRVHPEDYELGRKMAADALELDEEDVKAETDENGAGAIVRKLFREDEQEKVNELILEEYAEQLEKNYNQRKRATLETIRAELQAPYEELRRNFSLLTPDQVFVMFTGETKESLTEGMIVPVNLRVVKDDFAIAKLDCGIEGRIEAHEVNHRSNVSIRDVIHVNQTVQAKIVDLNRKDFLAKLTLREDALRRPYKKHNDHDRGTWDFRQEDDDKDALREKDKTTGRTQRVIKHPLFKPFNSTQAEEFLGSQSSGDVVIRPSSKGNDHLTVTWKVADGVYQHIDVLELQKETEFSVGKTLRIGGKYTYTDLDELIVDHVKAMAKKVDEMMGHEKFKKGSVADAEKWLTSYSDANPNRSIYLFCINPKRAGYFYLCFKASKTSRINMWDVKVVPHAFEMMGSQYPHMLALCNGFKLRFNSEISRLQQMRR
ncbi:transcription elongation factor Spt6 [Daldinia caldariorum]|uniref:transcription elongation factor Spt6 n=1 Tax=Daldinia caldariorum TaxID=326644 RepID=UPI0020074B05|nr:transcription elongation factor Spt6 [Daldinia caldariorum]KAI1467885.1 transcription elongation factor Spt6 [Daldinia caldariorum]